MTRYDDEGYALAGPIRRRMNVYRAGRHFGYPLCCIVRFAAGSTLKPSGQARRRGVHRRSVTSSFVPCGVFHHATEWPRGSQKSRA